jgi:hypothetical protein
VREAQAADAAADHQHVNISRTLGGLSVKAVNHLNGDFHEYSIEEDFLRGEHLPAA